jgi:hypothetical protein
MLRSDQAPDAGYRERIAASVLAMKALPADRQPDGRDTLSSGRSHDMFQACPVSETGRFTVLLRRSILGGGAGALLPPAVVMAQAKEKLTVVNAHHTSWGPCLRWRAQVEPVWRETKQFGKVSYFRVEVRSQKLIPLKSEWPEELRWVLDLFLVSPEAAGVKAIYTPRFIAASKAQNKLLYTTHGFAGWTERFKPWLDKRLGA